MLINEENGDSIEHNQCQNADVKQPVTAVELAQEIGGRARKQAICLFPFTSHPAIAFDLLEGFLELMLDRPDVRPEPVLAGVQLLCRGRQLCEINFGDTFAGGQQDVFVADVLGNDTQVALEPRIRIRRDMAQAYAEQ